MPCAERDKLLDLLLATAKAHSDAAQSTIVRNGKSLKCARQWAATAREAFEDCREVLAAHERSHGCDQPIFTQQTADAIHFLKEEP